MSETSLVSVVMCTYNGAMYLDEQVKSILMQEAVNLELIIVDDCSTDNTWAKLKQWQEKDRRIHLFRNELNLGYNRNFEQAIQKATGAYIAIADQDDIWMPSKLKKQVASLQSTTVVLSHCRSVRLQKGRLRIKSASLHHPFVGNDSRKLFMFNQINGHDMVFKKELMSKAMPLPKGMMYDWWIGVMATCYGNIVSVNELLVHHRIHEQNSFFTEKKERIKQPDLPEYLIQFANIPSLKPEALHFLTQLIQAIRLHEQRVVDGFDTSFFNFLLVHGKTIFGHKKRWVPWFNYVKSAFKYSGKTYTGKGLSF